MRVILFYDISTTTENGKQRLPKVMSLCRQYLIHIQKSVFEGTLTPSQLQKLMQQLESIINPQEDILVIYTFPDNTKYNRYFISNLYDPSSNII